jgi:HK97 family phage portal protein
MFYGGINGGKTKSGSRVSEYNALQLEIVWCCIKILSEDIASLPLHLYRRLDNGGKERAFNHPLYSLLHDSPNPEMTAFSFREAYVSHILSWGNGYAEKVYGRGLIGRNTIEQLWPITPNRVKVKRNKGEIPSLPLKSLYYHISMSGTGLNDVNLFRKNIFHTPGLSFDGIVGYSPIAYFRESIGLGKTYKEYAELYFGNGTHPSAVVTHPNEVKDYKVKREALSEVYAGLGNAHKLMLLEDGMTFQRVGIPNDEAQFLESQKLSNIDIGTRIYRLFPQQYGEYDKSSTYASAEQFAIDYVTKTLRAWLVRLEQSYNMQLLIPEERRTYFFEHNVEGLLRGDIKSRYEAYVLGKRNGFLNADEIRDIENLNPIPYGLGKEYIIERNMLSLDDLINNNVPNNGDNNATK